jgi:hypothetical protein
MITDLYQCKGLFSLCLQDVYAASRLHTIRQQLLAEGGNNKQALQEVG